MAPSLEKVYGIQELYRTAGLGWASVEPEIDIVAVHGLNGDARGTWSSKRNRICWLDHPEFLPKHLERNKIKARILTWGYNSSFSSAVGSMPSGDNIMHHAHSLVSQLSSDRRLEGMTGKPIIFLCHSLGGLVVKRAISYSKERTGERVCSDHDIFSCTHGILFFGTPHHGSDAAKRLSYIETVAAFTSPHVKSSLVNALKIESETIQNITDYFVPLMKHFHVFFLWEQDKTKLPLGRLGLSLSRYIVTSDSAAPNHDNTERAGIAANHSGMVKFDDASSQGFRTVVEAIIRYCQSAPADIALRQAHAAELIRRERRTECLQMIGRIQTTADGPPVSMTAATLDPLPRALLSSALSGTEVQGKSSDWIYQAPESRGSSMNI